MIVNVTPGGGFANLYPYSVAIPTKPNIKDFTPCMMKVTV
jgi:hypothetical protein